MEWRDLLDAPAADRHPLDGIVARVPSTVVEVGVVLVVDHGEVVELG